jgi:hypothetical protein
MRFMTWSNEAWNVTESGALMISAVLTIRALLRDMDEKNRVHSGWPEALASVFDFDIGRAITYEH